MQILIKKKVQLKMKNNASENKDGSTADTDVVPYIAPKPSNIFSLGWNSATTFSEKAGQNSWRGRIDFQSYITPSMTLGFAFMWSRFTDKRERETYEKVQPYKCGILEIP